MAMIPPANGGQDPLDLYHKIQDGFRQDIRAYAGMLFQLIVLLVTTLTLVVGWSAKDFFVSKYEASKSSVGIAGQAIAPAKALPPKIVLPPKPAAGTHPMQPAARSSSPAGAATRPASPSTGARPPATAAGRFWQDLPASPVTSAFLSILCMVFSTITATTIVLGYVVATRRDTSHEMLYHLDRRMPFPIPEQDRVDDFILTTAAILLFALFVFGGAISLAITNIYVIKVLSSSVVASNYPRWVIVGAKALACGALFKTVESLYLGWRYARWDYRKRARSRYAYGRFWDRLTLRHAEIAADIPVEHYGVKGKVALTHNPHVRYIWQMRKTERRLDIIVRYANGGLRLKRHWIDRVKPIMEAIARAPEQELEVRSGIRWACIELYRTCLVIPHVLYFKLCCAEIRLRIKIGLDVPDQEVAVQAADLMNSVIQGTLQICNEESGYGVQVAEEDPV